MFIIQIKLSFILCKNQFINLCLVLTQKRIYEENLNLFNFLQFVLYNRFSGFLHIYIFFFWYHTYVVWVLSPLSRCHRTLKLLLNLFYLLTLVDSSVNYFLFLTKNSYNNNKNNNNSFYTLLRISLIESR